VIKFKVLNNQILNEVSFLFGGEDSETNKLVSSSSSQHQSGHPKNDKEDKLMNFVAKIAHIGYKLRAFAMVAVCLKILRGDVMTSHGVNAGGNITVNHNLNVDPETLSRLDRGFRLLEVFGFTKIVADPRVQEAGANISQGAVNQAFNILGDVLNSETPFKSGVKKLGGFLLNIARNDDNIEIPNS